MEAFEIVGQADQGPFQSGFVVTSHGKAPKAHGGFDDSDDGFDCLFSETVEGPAGGRGCAVFHSRDEVGFKGGCLGLGMLLELPDGAAVGLAAHGGEDLQTGSLRFEFFDVFLAGEAVVHEHGGGADMFLHSLQVGGEFLLVVGRLADADSNDEARVGVDSSLGVVALLESVLGWHDAAFGVGEVDLVCGFGRRSGGLGLPSSWLFSVFAQSFAFGDFGLIFGGFGSDACLSSEFHFGPGLAQRCHALVSAL